MFDMLFNYCNKQKERIHVHYIIISKMKKNLDSHCNLVTPDLLYIKIGYLR